MAASKKPYVRELKRAEIEITWADSGRTEVIQTEGMSYNNAALVMTEPGGVHNMVVPLTSIRKFRILRAS